MKKFLILIILYPLLHGCKKEVGVAGPVGPQGPAGPAGVNALDTGTISGTAFLFNEFSFRNAHQAGTVVTLISGTTQITDTTDTAGQYQFHGIPTGTYNLTYILPGFGSVKRYGISHFGGGILPTEVAEVDLVQVPVKTAIDSISLSTPYGYVEVTITLDTSSLQYVQYYQNFLLLIGKTAAVSQTNYVKTYNTLFNPDGLGNYIVEFAKSDLASFFNTGDTMYITACTYNRYLHPNSSQIWFLDDFVNESFVDPNTGYVIFPSAGFLSSPVPLVY